MKTSAPTSPVLIISIVLFALGLLAFLGMVPTLAGYAFWLVTAGYVVLLVGNLATGL